jgi:thymidylate kinase
MHEKQLREQRMEFQAELNKISNEQKSFQQAIQKDYRNLQDQLKQYEKFINPNWLNVFILKR